jgi:glycosyltransferase involved in cell wall biosynthesis
MAKLTVITITRDEERNIVECLDSVRWADQLVVVDSGSVDRTVDLARRFTGDIYTIDWEGYGHARNFALDHAAGEWILWLDADERVPPELATEIQDLVGRDVSGFSGFSVARRAYFLGKWIRHCGWYPSRVVRLFRKDRGRFSENRVHERLDLQGEVGMLRHDLLHFTDQHLQQYLTKFNRYTTLAAQDMAANGRRFRLADLLVRPPFVFVKMYVLRLGFLDGIHGFILSVLSSAYVFSKYAKLWELSRADARERHRSTL